MENIVKEKTSNESENSATMQQKQKFKTLDDVLNDNNWDNAPQQAGRSFECTDSKKKVKMEWKINKDKQIHKRAAENVSKNKPGPPRADKSVKNPSFFHRWNDGQHFAIYRQEHATCNRQFFTPFWWLNKM